MDLFEVANELREAAGRMDDALVDGLDEKAKEVAISVATLVLRQVPAELTAPAET
ncbi:hypothetical protein ES707_15308 [subsurface metagenome]